MKRNRKSKIARKVLEEQILSYSLYKNRELKIKL